VTSYASYIRNDFHPETAPVVKIAVYGTSSRNSSNIRQVHNTGIVLASSSPLDVLDFYRKLIARSGRGNINSDHLKTVECFNCDKKGHYLTGCTATRKNENENSNMVSKADFRNLFQSSLKDMFTINALYRVGN
jgi:hypothetical protein